MATLSFDATRVLTLPGMSTSAVVSHLKDRSSKHTIQYIAPLRHFRVTFYANDKTHTTYIHESRPMCWSRLEE